MTGIERPAPETEADAATADGARPPLAVRLARLWPAFPDPFRRAPLRWRRRLFWADRILGGAIAGFAGLSLLWTTLYGVLPVPGTILMVQRALEGMDVRYQWRGLDRISPDLARAVIAAEDSRFCAHPGFDYDAIQTALREAEGGGRLRGASTISQQTAKNAFLFPQRSWLRKGAETWFTMLAEAVWTKRRTMEVYLNAAEWGDGLFGAEAAARARFGKSAAELTEREAALLAAVLPNPHEWRVDPPGPYVAGRASSLQGRLRDVRASGLDSCVL
jgi:monofunctional biosynthetic peptidoglycan transglycosylase